MASMSAIGVVFGIILISMSMSITNAHSASPPKSFNVLSYGATPDGNTDNSEAFSKAWNDACKYKGRSEVVIPMGIYMSHAVTFTGPCNNDMSMVIRGMIKAPTYPTSLFFNSTWIGFRYINGLSVNGGGVLDGQGAAAWPYNDCSKNPHCAPLPATMRFDFVNNANLYQIKSVNSKNTHFNVFACNNMNISEVTISAPENSPNTDGIHIGDSTNIRISNSRIGTGDDCISMVSGSQNIRIYDVFCGPGHGISIGSLGNDIAKEYVTGVLVRNCTFHSTQNGVRIKTRPTSYQSYVDDITFRDINMVNVNNPIFIDQQYCPPPCSTQGSNDGGVRISDVTYKNIQGTSSSQEAVTLNCSSSVPCQNVKLVNINLSYHGHGGRAKSTCSNAKGYSYGEQFPPSCL